MAAAAAETAVAREERLHAILAPRQQSFYERNEPWLVSLAALAVGFGIWEGIVRAGVVRPTVLAGPTQIVGALVQMAASGVLWKDLSFSGLNFALGFALSVAVGVPLGLMMGMQRRVALALTPYIMGINSVPRLSFISLLIVWFGLGLQAKVVLIFLSAFFPIVINTWSGVRVVDAVLLRAGRAYGAKGWQLFRRVVIPYSLPFIMTGLRLGVSHGLIGVFASEIFGTNIGIGYRIISSGSNFRMPDLFAAVLIFAGIGVASTELLDFAERRVAPWRYARQL